jgi:S-ribosylhomocysteine lyase LuxS involved in autoinducer biosynthesis
VGLGPLWTGAENLGPNGIRTPDRQGERTGAYMILMGTPEEKRPVGRPRRIWEDNIKIDL